MRRIVRSSSIDTDIRTICMDLPCSVRGFCYHDLDGTPYIVLNSRLSHSQQKQTWRHEYRHIAHGDMYDTSYREYE